MARPRPLPLTPTPDLFAEIRGLMHDLIANDEFDPGLQVRAAHAAEALARIEVRFGQTETYAAAAVRMLERLRPGPVADDDRDDDETPELRPYGTDPS